ncbi:MAG: TlpA family protein disulfide reductase [Clostridia bacterium]|nr:TlpA family protein disulfide reductase [Clostridia bacterium]
MLKKYEKQIFTAIIVVLLSAVLAGALVYFNVIDKVPTDDLSQDDGSNDTHTNPTDPDLKVGNKVGNLAPTYEMRNVFGSGTTNIEDLRGQVVVINFWGTWCGPCKAELPYFDQLATEYDGSVKVIAVHTSLTAPEAPDYLTTYYPNTKMLTTYDDENVETSVDKYYKQLGGRDTYPMTIIVDKNGVITHKIVKSIHGYDELKGYAEEALAK